MWTELLAKVWPWLAGLALVIVIAIASNHAGYQSGRADEKAVWEPKLAAVDKAKLKAETESATKLALSEELGKKSEERYNDTLKLLDKSTADYQRTFHDLSLRIATLSQRAEVPAASGSASEPHDTSQVEERAQRAANGFASTGHNCESDALQLEELQTWLRNQQVLWSTKALSLP